MTKLSFDDGDGVWRTIGGRRVFIREGQSLSDAMKKSGKFKSAKKKSTTKDENKKFSNDELNEKYVERKKQMENWLDETNSGKLSKYEEEALKYEREKHGEKAYQDLKKEFGRGDDTFRKVSASGSNDKEEKKKIGGWRINEQGKKEYYERELADNERGYWTKENGQRVFKENPNYKGDKKELNLSQSQKEHFAGEELYDDNPNRFGNKMRQYNDKMAKEQNESAKRVEERYKKELNLSQRQKDEGNRLNAKAKSMARDDINTYLKGNKGNWDNDEDFVRDLANEHNIDRDEAQKMFNYQKYVNDTLNNDEYLQVNRPNEYFQKQMKESGVKTFADEIKENEKTSNKKYSVDYFKQRGVEIKDSVPKGYVKLEGATTAPKGYEWYSNGKSRFGGEYKNALVKKEEGSNQITNALRRKAYQKYLREHPASKISFDDFKDMRKYQ